MRVGSGRAGAASVLRSSSQSDGREAEPTFGTVVTGGRQPVDAQLVLLAKEDRGAAFEILYAAYRGRIYSFLLRLSASAELADDLAQETFEKAYRALTRLERDHKLLPWLYRIANNTAIDHLRRRRRFGWVPWGALHGTAEEPSTPDIHASVPDRTAIEAILGSIPPDNAAALLLHALEGYSYQEIAEIQGVSLPAVRSRIARARAAFKERWPA